MKTTILYNPRANNGGGAAAAEKLKTLWSGRELSFIDATALDDYAAFLGQLHPEEEVCICGGDGSLNYLINHVDCNRLPNCVWYFPAGSGNDFWNDLGKTANDPPVLINRYLIDLPTVTVNGKTSKFINGVGYGIDGYCCEEGDRLRAVSDKPINYTSIAVKGLLFHFKPVSAEVTVDGNTLRFDKAWLAPTMKGRFYGGGMMATPLQDRLDPKRQVTCMVMNGAGKLRTLVAFPSIFKGEHIKKSLVHVMKGNTVTVKFDRPTALQIDGETVKNVSEYTVRTGDYTNLS